MKSRLCENDPPPHFYHLSELLIYRPFELMGIHLPNTSTPMKAKVVNCVIDVKNEEIKIALLLQYYQVEFLQTLLSDVLVEIRTPKDVLWLCR